MPLEKIKLFQFKNHENKTFELCPGFNCFIGDNGVGKTNVLDSIYYLCYTKSYFTRKEEEVVMHDKDAFSIHAEGQINKEKCAIIMKNNLKTKKTVSVNDTNYKTLADYIGFLNAVIITPTDILLVYEHADTRRKYLNNILASTNKKHLVELQEHKKLLTQRNLLLKQAQNSKLNEIVLESYDRKLIPISDSIYKERKIMVNKLNTIFKSIFTSFAGEHEVGELEYKSDIEDSNTAEVLRKNHRNDLAAARTTAGVHRDDISFSLNNKPLKSYGSQGQIKSFLIALKLAQFELLKELTNQIPLLLLDDIFEKIDEKRTKKLLSFVNESGYGQVFITDAHPERCKLFLDSLENEKKYFNLNP